MIIETGIFLEIFPAFKNNSGELIDTIVDSSTYTKINRSGLMPIF